MNFTHTEDRRMLADTLNRFVSEQYGIDTRNAIAYGDDGHSPALYAQFAELGAIGALFPESAGGFGGAGFDISVVFESLGRGLVAEPLLGALVVGQALITHGNLSKNLHLLPRRYDYTLQLSNPTLLLKKYTLPQAARLTPTRDRLREWNCPTLRKPDL